MWLVLALITAVIGALFAPFTNRLHGTGLWLGKALVDPVVARAMPNGMQDAITSGWPTALVLAMVVLRYTAVVLAFVHAWWAAPVVFILGSAIAGWASQTSIASTAIERYIGIFLAHAVRRQADFIKEGDTARAEMAGLLATDLEKLLLTYMDQGVSAPDYAVARSAPFGDEEYLLRLRHTLGAAVQ